MARTKRGNVRYKALFTVNIEITDDDDPSSVELGGGLRRTCTVKLEHAHRFPSPRLIGLVGRLEDRFMNYDYVEKNFPEAAEELYMRMLNFETIAANPSSPGESVYRNALIDWSGKEERRRIRRKFPRRRGRIKAIDQAGYSTEKEVFLNKCKQAFAELERAKKSRTKTNLAKILYPRNENKLRCLRDELAKFNLTFGDLL